MAHRKSTGAPTKSSTICNYVAPRFREITTPESTISTISPRSAVASVEDQFEVEDGPSKPASVTHSPPEDEEGSTRPDDLLRQLEAMQKRPGP